MDIVLSTDELKGVVGHETVRKALSGAMQSAGGLPPEGSLAQFIHTAILDPLQQSAFPFVALLPVVHLLVRCPLSLGAVTFVSKETASAEYMDFCERHVQTHTADDRENRRQEHAACWTFMNGTADAYARVEARASLDYAYDVAISRSSAALNVLRAFTHVFKPRFDVRFGLPSEVPSGDWALTTMSEEHDMDVGTMFKRRGSLMPFELDADTKTRLEGPWGLGQLHSWAKDDRLQPGTLALAIWQCLQAVGRSIVTIGQDQALLHCMIGMEVLLFRDNEQTTVEKFSDRLAWLVGQTKENRLAAASAVKRLYNERSAVVHEGKQDIDPKDVGTAEYLARLAARRAMEREAHTPVQADFCARLHESKFG